MQGIISKLFLGNVRSDYRYVHPAIRNQWKNIQSIWNDEKDKTFGIERVARLILAFSAYIFPGLYIRHFFGKWGLLSRKIAVEVYVILKLILLISYLIIGVDSIGFVQFFNAYLLIETLFYLLGLIFLSDIYVSPISNKRSFIMAMVNYIEMTLGFAVIYHGNFLLKNAATVIDSVYFSFITSTTVGYGDISPNNQTGKIVVIAQVLFFLVLVSLVISNVVSNISSKNGTYKHNEKK